MSGGFRPTGWLPTGYMAPIATPLVALALVAGTPVLDTPALAQVHALAASEVVGGAPVLDTPPLTPVHVLAAGELAAGAVVLDTPPLTPVHVFAAPELAAGAPALDAPGLAQVHKLFTGIGTIEVGFEPIGLHATGMMPRARTLVIGPDLETGDPVLDAPLLFQVHYLVATDIATGAPVLPGLIIVSPSGLFVNYAGTWIAPIAYGKHAGTWKDVVQAYRRTATAWELIYERVP